ncbi:lipoprotein [Klebsiella quasipneumoniae]|nr:lipoprotein [Klebsiella quasipneumoniae]
MIPVWSLTKNAETGRVEQINRDQVKSMDELDN